VWRGENEGAAEGEADAGEEVRGEEADAGAVTEGVELVAAPVAGDDGTGNDGDEGGEADEMEAGERERGTDADGWARVGSGLVRFRGETPAGHGSSGEVGLYERGAPLMASGDRGGDCREMLAVGTRSGDGGDSCSGQGSCDCSGSSARDCSCSAARATSCARKLMTWCCDSSSMTCSHTAALGEQAAAEMDGEGEFHEGALPGDREAIRR